METTDVGAIFKPDTHTWNGTHDVAKMVDYCPVSAGSATAVPLQSYPLSLQHTGHSQDLIPALLGPLSRVLHGVKTQGPNKTNKVNICSVPWTCALPGGYRTARNGPSDLGKG
ncbi:hypothetical protein FKM82_030628 [Ascaphus truei]